jgi:hypothetical protein
MIINTEILDTYLSEKSLEGIKNHWIFNSIVEEQYLIEENTGKSLRSDLG